MPIPIYLYALAVLVVPWAIVNTLLVPKPIARIPYNKFARYMPWGDLADLGVHNLRTGEVFDWFTQQCLKHKSPLIQLFLPSFSCTHPVLVLTDLCEIRNITTRRMAEIDRADLMHTWFGVIVPRATIGLKSKDPAFRAGRKLWNTILEPKFLEDVVAKRFYEVAVGLCELWDKKAEAAGSGYAFEAQEDLRQATLDAIWKVSVGSELGLLKSRIGGMQLQRVSKTRDGTAVFSQTSWPEFYNILRTLLMCLDWVSQGISPRFYTWIFRWTGILGRAEQRKNQILDSHIVAARIRVRKRSKDEDSNVEATCALDAVLQKARALMRGKTEDEGEVIADEALRDELLELLVTGHETTASSIAWALKYLTDNPLSQDRLRESLFAALTKPGVSTLSSLDDITAASLPYLDGVIAETLRCSATGPVSFRQTIAPCEIIGYSVPIGTPLVLVTASPVRHRPNIYGHKEIASLKSSQAARLERIHSFPEGCPHNHLEDFVPERWIGNGKFEPNAVAMLPFSAGSRGCFGKRIAMLEMRIIIAVLVMGFEFPRLRPGLSGYAAKDHLTRRPSCCYISPKAVQ